MEASVCILQPYKHAGSDSVGYGQLWPFRPVCIQNWAGSYNYAGSDFPHPIRFRLPKKAWITILLCKTGPGPIWIACSGSCQTHLVQKQAGMQESSGAVLAGHSRPASSFSTFRRGCVTSFTDGPDHTVQNQLGSDLVLVDC